MVASGIVLRLQPVERSEMDFEPAYNPLSCGESVLAAAHLDGRNVPGRFAALTVIPF